MPEHLRRALRLAINVGIAAATGFALLQPLGGKLRCQKNKFFTKIHDMHHHDMLQKGWCDAYQSKILPVLCQGEVSLSFIKCCEESSSWFKAIGFVSRMAFAMGLPNDDGNKVGGYHVSSLLLYFMPSLPCWPAQKHWIKVYINGYLEVYLLQGQHCCVAGLWSAITLSSPKPPRYLIHALSCQSIPAA